MRVVQEFFRRVPTTTTTSEYVHGAMENGQYSLSIKMKLVMDKQKVPQRIVTPLKPHPSEEELLGMQKYMCAGCGDPLSTGLFQALESEKNYLYCEHSGHLYCKRWCHFSLRSPIPEKVLGEPFDCTPYSVSLSSYQFLSKIWQKPIVCIDERNKSLYEAAPILRNLQDKRRQAIASLKNFHTSDVSKHKLLGIISATVEFRRAYLFIDEFAYSMEDIMSISQGNEYFYTQLCNFVSALEKCV